MRRYLLLLLILTISAHALAEERTAQQIYNTSCATCHMSGVANAPKSHDAAAWKAKNKSLDQFLESAKKGLNVMPPMGLCMDCTDSEMKAVIEFMMKPASR